MGTREATPHNARFVIVTVSEPVMLRRSDDETWLLNPRRRYVLNADVLGHLKNFIETLSDLELSALHRPIRAASAARLAGATLLIDRYRDRGLGDLLFTTGPLAYLHHLSGGSLRAYLYAYAERGMVLNQCPFLAANSPLVGPVLYEELGQYDYHWFTGAVTEYDEEPDQLNVYDALYASLGIDPATVDARFKRPTAVLAVSEVKSLDDLYYWIFTNTKLKLDLRHTGYYVVAPLANSSLRSAPYAMWLRLIAALAERRPVLVVGALRERMPSTDMAVGEFAAYLDQELVRDGRVLNLLGKTQVRGLMQLISKANCVVSLDSAALYIAQALRVPCVSLWGTHDPRVRLGYDPDYMNLALWPLQACRHSPCHAWQQFPANRCPQGENQTICQCQQAIEWEKVAGLVDHVESQHPKSITLAKAGTL